MVRVIERRNPKDERIGKFRCWKCSSVIETEKDDIAQMTFHLNRSADPRERDYWTIPCPVCGAGVTCLYAVK